MTEDPASWTDLIHEPVHTADDERLGEIEAVSRNFLVVKKGLVNIHRFYVPLTKVRGWDGRAVWLNVSEEEALTKYENDKRPDPHLYHYSSAQPSDAANTVRDFQINMPKIDRTYEEEGPYLTTKDHTESPVTYPCELCASQFRSQSELDEHISGKH